MHITIADGNLFLYKASRQTNQRGKDIKLYGNVDWGA